MRKRRKNVYWWEQEKVSYVWRLEGAEAGPGRLWMGEVKLAEPTLARDATRSLYAFGGTEEECWEKLGRELEQWREGHRAKQRTNLNRDAAERETARML